MVYLKKFQFVQVNGVVSQTLKAKSKKGPKNNNNHNINNNNYNNEKKKDTHGRVHSLHRFFFTRDD